MPTTWWPSPATPTHHASPVIRSTHRASFRAKHQPPRATSTLLDPGAPPPPTSTTNRSHETDYVVIGRQQKRWLSNRLAFINTGSGIGGLCCAALLAKYGHGVTVVESHYHPGGAAHAFDVQARAHPLSHLSTQPCQTNRGTSLMPAPLFLQGSSPDPTAPCQATHSSRFSTLWAKRSSVSRMIEYVVYCYHRIITCETAARAAMCCKTKPSYT